MKMGGKISNEVLQERRRKCPSYREWGKGEVECGQKVAEGGSREDKSEKKK